MAYTLVKGYQQNQGGYIGEKKIQTMRLTVFLRTQELFWSNWDSPEYGVDGNCLAPLVNKDPAIADWQPHAVMFDYVFDHGDKVLAKKKLLEVAERILNSKVQELSSAAERVHWELGTYEEVKDA